MIKIFSFFALCVFVVALAVFFGYNLMNLNSADTAVDDKLAQSGEGTSEIIYVTDYEQPEYGVGAVGYNTLEFCHRESTAEGEVFSIAEFGAIEDGSFVRVGLDYIPELAVLRVNADPEHGAGVVYFLVRNEIIQAVQSLDAVQIRVELISPSGKFTGGDSLEFYPEMSHLNPECKNYRPHGHSHD